MVQKNFNRLKEIMKVSIIQTTVFCIIAAVLMSVGSNEIMSIFSSDNSVKATGSIWHLGLTALRL